MAKRGAYVFAVALLIALGVAFVLRDTPGYVDHVANGRLRGDIYHYVLWTRLVALGGMEDAYSGTWPETYAVYGPVVLYPWQFVGNVYLFLVDSDFDLARAESSLWLLRA